MKELRKMQDCVKEVRDLESSYEDINALIELTEEEEDREMIKEIQREIAKFEKEFEDLRIRTLLSGEYDSCNAIVTLHAGAGGTDSCDWANMLYRMYTRYAQSKGFQITVLDYQDGDITGLKGITFEVTGDNAYGYFQSEKGVHRLVRIDIELNDDDLRIDTYRSSGAGGQHINKTSSAVRITHLPTGIVVQCQNERSQLFNKDKAMQMLKAKLYLLKKQEQEEKVSGIRGEVQDINFGSQIRSYILHPYNLVKDHRTGEETGNVSAVLDGELDPFINAYLKQRSNNG